MARIRKVIAEALAPSVAQAEQSLAEAQQRVEAAEGVAADASTKAAEAAAGGAGDAAVDRVVVTERRAALRLQAARQAQAEAERVLQVAKAAERDAELAALDSVTGDLPEALRALAERSLPAFEQLAELAAERSRLVTAAREATKRAHELRGTDPYGAISSIMTTPGLMRTAVRDQLGHDKWRAVLSLLQSKGGIVA